MEAGKGKGHWKVRLEDCNALFFFGRYVLLLTLEDRSKTPVESDPMARKYSGNPDLFVNNVSVEHSTYHAMVYSFALGLSPIVDLPKN